MALSFQLVLAMLVSIIGHLSAVQNDNQPPSSKSFLNYYRYGYEVSDAENHNEFTHSQTRQSGATKGEYRILLPDGVWQTVTYVADDGGYRAKVRYEDPLPAEEVYWLVDPVPYQRPVLMKINKWETSDPYEKPSLYKASDGPPKVQWKPQASTWNQNQILSPVPVPVPVEKDNQTGETPLIGLVHHQYTHIVHPPPKIRWKPQVDISDRVPVEIQVEEDEKTGEASLVDVVRHPYSQRLIEYSLLEKEQQALKYLPKKRLIGATKRGNYGQRTRTRKPVDFNSLDSNRETAETTSKPFEEEQDLSAEDELSHDVYSESNDVNQSKDKETTERAKPKKRVYQVITSSNRIKSSGLKGRNISLIKAKIHLDDRSSKISGSLKKRFPSNVRFLENSERIARQIATFNDN